MKLLGFIPFNKTIASITVFTGIAIAVVLTLLSAIVWDAVSIPLILGELALFAAYVSQWYLTKNK